ncbi:hypothetical protein [uncultured Jatrophihabitans sp.]|uniref:hypothetical protein n=1 Tax=uncultured Jatrophihabitans sp. TaxID=1610747 RepID=UPI0035CC867C
MSNDGSTVRSAATRTDRADAASTAVAIAILALIGLVLGIGAVRYSEGDLSKLIGALGPLLGIVTGAFVTYFFTRSAVQTTKQAADVQTEQATTARNRSQALHNALTDVLAGVSQDQAADLKKLTSVRTVLGD